MGNLRLHYQCCIHDSSFNGDIEDIESNSEVEKEPFKIIERGIDKCDSFMTDVSPLKVSHKKRD
jgi:hypothetical protein